MNIYIYIANKRTPSFFQSKKMKKKVLSHASPLLPPPPPCCGSLFPLLLHTPSLTRAHTRQTPPHKGRGGEGTEGGCAEGTHGRRCTRHTATGRPRRLRRRLHGRVRERDPRGPRSSRLCEPRRHLVRGRLPPRMLGLRLIGGRVLPPQRELVPSRRALQ